MSKWGHAYFAVSRAPHRIVFAIVSIAFALAFAGCSDDSLTSNGGNGGGSDSNDGNGGSGAGQGGNCFGCNQGGGTTGEMSIVPPEATIEVIDGVAQPVDFNAEIGGVEVQPSGWVVNLSSVATTDGNGIVTATGNVGGLVTLRAEYGGQVATAEVTVRIKRTLNPEALPPNEIAILQNPTGGQDASVVWAYPYNGTVFPKGILAPELMWNNAAAGDKYYVHLTSPYAEFEIFTTAAPPARHQLDQSVWTQLTESGTGGTVDFKVNRLPAGAQAATTVIDHDWTVANGALRGTVYYWANDVGRILRIKPGDGAPEDFLAAAGISNTCSTCHTVSANGSTLIIGGDVSPSTFDLLTNTSVFSTTSVGKPVRNWAMPALSPDGTLLIENAAALPGPPGGSPGVWESATGVHLTTTGLEGVQMDMPAWSPDGTLIAYVDHSTKGLAMYSWDHAARTASGQTALVAQNLDPSNRPIAFPSVAPDAEWVVYHRGALDTRGGDADLYLASTTQAGVEIRLANANGDAYPFAAGDRDRNENYEPTFAPLEAGGYAWVVYTSRRTYGNRLTGGSGDTKQLWVAAINRDPQAGVDPSHPPFRVPGQNLDDWNMRGFWALDPCKDIGAECTNGSECCNQNCVDGFCEEPDPTGCSETGNACEEAADCCDPMADCVNGFCTEPPPQ